MADQKTAAGGIHEGYADVNGVHLFYRIYGDPGQGTPLVLLHGGFGLVEMFGELIPSLAHGRAVIGVDLQGHGRTADVDRPLSFESMADDIAALIQHLGLPRADVLGYSLGGGAAIQTAIRHPDVVRKLVIVSAPVKRQGWLPDVLENMAQMTPEAAAMMKDSPMQQAYAAVAPRPEDFPRLAGKTGDLLRRPYDYSTDFARIPMPALLVFGDADSVRLAHAVEMFELLGGNQRDAGWDGSGMVESRLAILPGTSHYNTFQSPLLPGLVLSFLDAPGS